ncbi:MAG: hypothetical protein EPN26_02180 [Rhodospirillales bacterium]|nr:MAG: hypothetical protein EPN26_02180 [Rhodospirillales bacterium]
MNDRIGTGIGLGGGLKSPLVPENELAPLFARVFRDGDGVRALEHLKAMTLERHLGPEASDAQLRHLEGQRHLVNHILSLVRRGREGQPFVIQTKEN